MECKKWAYVLCRWITISVGRFCFPFLYNDKKRKISPYDLRQHKIDISSLEEIFGTFLYVDTSTVD